MGEFIETGPVVETLPVGGGSAETSQRRIDIQEETPRAPSAPAAPARKTSARDRLFSEMEKRSSPSAPTPDGPDSASTPQDQAQDPSPEAPEGAADTPSDPSESDAAASEGKPGEGEEGEGKGVTKGKPESPWRLVKTYKERTKALEAEVADLKSRIAPEGDFKLVMERAEKAETELKKAQDILRFRDYESSQEFQDKHVKPWDEAWQKIGRKLSQISVTDPVTGEKRPAATKDLAPIVNAPLGQAREMAEEMFGAFANDVMNMVDKVHELWEARQTDINQVKSQGEERQKLAQTELLKTKAKVAKVWEAANKELLEDKTLGPLFKPREGDEEWNKRLTAGEKFVEEAFATLQPLIKDKEALDEMVRLHAALRYRAIAFGPLRHENAKLRAELKTWKDKYEAISKSSPPTGTGAQRGTTPSVPSKARDRFFANMEKISHPT